jgi:hypothetical protein
VSGQKHPVAGCYQLKPDRSAFALLALDCSVVKNVNELAMNFSSEHAAGHIRDCSTQCAPCIQQCGIWAPIAPPLVHLDRPASVPVWSDKERANYARLVVPIAEPCSAPPIRTTAKPCAVNAAACCLPPTS